MDYDPEWPHRFEAERARILEALQGLDVTVEHVGSTSVPGLAAKPIIDIMIMVANAQEQIRAITPLVHLDYICRGEAEIPGRIFFRKGEPRARSREPDAPAEPMSTERDLARPRTFHLHLYSRGHPEIERHLLFRDYLRMHPEAAHEYEQLKRALAEKYRNDRAAYTEAKTEFIRAVEAQARSARKV